jgi:transposase-like protein
MNNPVRNSRKEFLEMYAEYYKAGKTREELAEALGIKVESVYSRVQVEKRRGNAMPLIPGVRRNDSDEQVSDVLSELASLAQHGKSQKDERAKAKAKPEPVQEDGDDAASEDEIEALLNS